MSKTILFDFDGVVLDSMPYHAKAWVKVFGDQGITITPEMIYFEEGRPSPDIAALVLREHGFHWSDQEYYTFASAKQDYYLAAYSPRIFSEMPPLLQDLALAGCNLGLVTGSMRKNIKATLPESLNKLFQVVITSDDIDRGKPDPQPFLRAAESIGVDPQKCIVVENAPRGVASAKAAGMHVVAICSTLTPEDLHQADEVVADFQELRSNLLSKVGTSGAEARS